MKRHKKDLALKAEQEKAHLESEAAIREKEAAFKERK
jgi:hypothetical protein